MSASSLIAVTVCTDPAISCSLPSAAQFMQVHPKNIGLAADGTGSVNNLVWLGKSAGNRPRNTTDNRCNPDCAQGTFTGYPVTVTNTTEAFTRGTVL